MGTLKNALGIARNKTSEKKMRTRQQASSFAVITTLAVSFAALTGSLFSPSNADAGIIQWRNRVPAAEANPKNIGSYVNTIEIGNGGTKSYDAGLDVDLDTSLMPNDNFFVTYVDQNPKKVEYEFTQDLLPGESYTAKLSFQNKFGDSFYTPNTIEFLAADGNWSYDLKLNSNGYGGNNVFRSGNVSDILNQATPEIASWNQWISSGQDWRNDKLVGFPNGWYYGELTLTNNIPEPKSLALAGMAIGTGLAGGVGFSGRKKRKSDS